MTTKRIFGAAPAAVLAGLLPAAAWGQAPAEQIVPLVVEGNGWMQTIEIGNAESGGPSVGEIRFYRTDGAPWEIGIAGRGRSEGFSFVLQPNETIVYETAAHNDAVKAGWASVRGHSGSLSVRSHLNKRLRLLSYRLDLRCSFVPVDGNANKARLYFDNVANRESKLGISLPVDDCRGECAISCNAKRE